MQSRALLGMQLGQLASGLMGGFDIFRQRGALDGMRTNELASQIALQEEQQRKIGADADIARRQLDLGNDDSLARTAALASGMTGQAANNFGNYVKSGYVPLVTSYAPDILEKGGDAAKTLASLRTALAIGDRNMDLPKVIQGIQRNNLTQNLTPNNAPRVALATAAMDGKDPANITEAALMQSIAGGGEYMPLAKALLAGKGKGAYDNFDGGVTNVLDGSQTINPIGVSKAAENNAQATQASAGAKENLAQAALAGVRGANIQAGKGDGTQSQQLRDFAQIRDDIRADYNAIYPIGVTGKRPKTAPDFDAFTRAWLRQYNIDENAFFRNNDNPITRPMENKPSAAYQEYLDAYNRAAGRPEIQRKITERARAAGIVK